MPVIEVKFDQKDLDRVLKWAYIDLYDVIDDHTIWGQRAIRRAGISMMRNFNYEGGTYGQMWQKLSQYTQQTREQRGYHPQHPIMVQSGELRRITAGTISGSRIAGSSFIARDKDGKNVMASGWRGRTWSATVGGPKVQNQFGGVMFTTPNPRIGGGGAGYLPARPFFYILASDVPLMTEDTVAAIMGHWQTKGKGVKRAYGRVSVLPSNARTR